MRQSIAVTDSEPRMLVIGPARLLHLQVEKRKGGVRLFKVPRQYGTNADCRGVSDRDEVALTPRHTSVEVAKNEVVCAKVDRKARLSWHATSKSDVDQPYHPLYQASLALP